MDPDRSENAMKIAIVARIDALEAKLLESQEALVQRLLAESGLPSPSLSQSAGGDERMLSMRSSEDSKPTRCASQALALITSRALSGVSNLLSNVKPQQTWQEAFEASGSEGDNEHWVEPIGLTSTSSWVPRHRSSWIPHTSSLMRTPKFSDITVTPLQPGSLLVTLWGILGLVVLAFELAMQPLAIFADKFGQTMIDVFITTVFMSCIYWAMNIFFSLVIGEYDLKGDLRFGWRSYLRTWCLFDLAMLVADVLDLILGIGAQSHMGYLATLARTLRLVKVIRVLRCQALFDRVAQRLESRTVVSALRISQCLVGIICFLHLVACGWCAVGTSRRPGQASWLDSINTSEFSWEYTYVTSANWALTQLGSGSTSAHGANTQEMSYAVISGFVAVLLLSLVMGYITSIMVELLNFRREQKLRRSQVWEFFKQHGLSKELRYMCLTSQNYHKRTAGIQTLADIEHMFPAKYYGKMQHELLQPLLRVHPFFRKFQRMTKSEATSVVVGMTAELKCEQGGQLFTFGNRGTNLFLLGKGAVEFVDMSTRNASSAVLKETEWLSEASLWFQWRHQGNAVCLQESYFTTVAADKFQEFFAEAPMTHAYARVFFSLVLSSDLELSDLMADHPRLQQFVAEHVDEHPQAELAEQTV